MKDRLEWTDTNLLRAFLVFVETQSWMQRDDRSKDDTDSDDMADIGEAVEYIISVFHTPLETKGVCIATIQDELEEAVRYARSYLPIASESYQRIWFKRHTCPDSDK